MTGVALWALRNSPGLTAAVGSPSKKIVRVVRSPIARPIGRGTVEHITDARICPGPGSFQFDGKYGQNGIGVEIDLKEGVGRACDEGSHPSLDQAR